LLLTRNHYDFYGDYCIHDLKFESFKLGESNDLFCESNNLIATLVLRRNKFKHPTDLFISYRGIRSVSIQLDKESKYNALFDIVIDEISWDEQMNLPVHEIRFSNGNMRIYFEDLEEKWDDIENFEI